METIKDRLLSFLQENELQASEFADMIGVQRSSISHILSERNKPSVDFIQKLLLAFPDIDIAWLLVGNHTRKTTSNPLQKSLFEELPLVKSNNESESHTITELRENSVQKKQIEKIISFYTDNTFTVYYPSLE